MSNKRVNPFKVKIHLLECEVEEKDLKISDLEAKLAEKEKEIVKLKDFESDWKRWHKLAFEYNEEINKDKKIIFNLKQDLENKNQEKIEFCIEQLEKLASNSVILEGMFLEGGHYLHQKRYNVVGKGDIENLIKQLKEGK